MTPGRARQMLAAVLLATALAGCAEVRDLPVVRQLEGSPTDVVGRMLTAVGRDDLATAASYTCEAARDPDTPPIDLGPFLLHLDALGASPARALQAVTLDFSALKTTETVRPDHARVEVDGEVLVAMDVDGVRALAAETRPEDTSLADALVALTGDGRFSVPYRATFELDRVNGAWRVCNGVDGGLDLPDQ